MKHFYPVVLLLACTHFTQIKAAPLIWEDRIGPPLEALTGTDSESTSVNLTSPFPFDGTDYTTVFVGSNGSLQLGSLGVSQGIHSHYASYMDEFTADMAPSIAVNTHFDLFANGTIHFNDLGYKSVFTWNEIGTFENENALSSFQIQLFADGAIFISLNGMLDGINEDLIDDLNEGIVVGISAGGQSPGTDPGPSDLLQVFDADTEIFARWCHDEANSCGFRGHGQTDRLVGDVNTAFNLDFTTVNFIPFEDGFKVNDIVFLDDF